MRLEPDKIKKAGNWVSALLLGDTRESVARIDERTEHLVKDIDSMKPKVDDMFPKVDILWRERVARMHSPRQLNERGRQILVESGIKEIVEEKRGELLQLIKQGNVATPYDAERTIESVMATIPQRYPEIVSTLKNGAFKSGSDIKTMLYVGSIHLRNIIFPELGFNIEDLDKK